MVVFVNLKEESRYNVRVNTCGYHKVIFTFFFTYFPFKLTMNTPPLPALNTTPSLGDVL